MALGHHGLEFADQSLQVRAWRFLVAASGLHGPATVMPEDDDKPGAQMFDGIFHRPECDCIHHVSGRADDKKIAQRLVENDFRRYAAIGAADDDRLRVLAGNKELPLIAQLMLSRTSFAEAMVALHQFHPNFFADPADRRNRYSGVVM